MAMTAFKPNEEMLSSANPFWVIAPTLSHFKHLLFDTPFTGWLWNTVIVSTAATIISLAASVFAAYAIERLRFQGSKQRSEEHTSELQSLMRISYAVFCFKKKKHKKAAYT